LKQESKDVEIFLEFKPITISVRKLEGCIVDIVVPCYNEEANLPKFRYEFERIKRKFPHIIFRIIIVDNASTDNTPSIARTFVAEINGSTYLLLSRNFGKEASLTAGVEHSTGDVCIPMDADMQDPIDLIPRMLDMWVAGADVVLARRSTRVGESKIRIQSSRVYLQLLNKFADVKIENSVGEFRLMDKVVVDAFRTLPENQRFVRGLFAWLGFETHTIDFNRPSRSEGMSRFSYRSLFNLGIDGMTSLTIAPLRIATTLGVVVSSFTFFAAFMILVLGLLGRISVPGYASTLIAVLILGGLQLIFIGILGEYVGKTLLESKRRPLYILKDRVSNIGN